MGNPNHLNGWCHRGCNGRDGSVGVLILLIPCELKNVFSVDNLPDAVAPHWPVPKGTFAARLSSIPAHNRQCVNMR